MQRIILRYLIVLLTVLGYWYMSACPAWGQVVPVPTTLNDFLLPGSQPGESGNLEAPKRCVTCHGGHGGHAGAVGPAFNWQGSMMAQAARDPLFYACMAIANQDAPDSGDLCIRCHSPAGWLEGRSVPTDGTALTNDDREGVQCDFCHKLVNPEAILGNPYPGEAAYEATFLADRSYLSLLADLVPPAHANGMYAADSAEAKRGPFVVAMAGHKVLYSPFHRESKICGTCHDVSNPVYGRQPDGSYAPNAFNAPSPDFDPYTLFPIERTYSEWLHSDFPDGVTSTEFIEFYGKETVSSCQDCHMQDVAGRGCGKMGGPMGGPMRGNVPQHDLTGGNTFIPLLIQQLYPNEVNAAALLDGQVRALATLQKAATIELTLDDETDPNKVTVRVTNMTGHKLPSGYPEGRRIWIHLQAFDQNNNSVYESGAYELETGVLNKDPSIKVYEIKPGIGDNLAEVVNLPVGPSFHFVLNNRVFSDNRIPPRGFTNAAFAVIQSPPVGDTEYVDGQYWDDTEYSVPEGTTGVIARLYYQTLSKEYVEFLRNENKTDHWGQTLYDLWNENDKSPPEIMVEAFWQKPGTGGLLPLTAPKDLTAQTRSRSQIDLQWGAATSAAGVASYEIFRNRVSVAQGIAGTRYSDTGLTAGSVYSYHVVAHDTVGNTSEASNTVLATTKTTHRGGLPHGMRRGKRQR